jgi:hypothetical protein
LLTLAKEVFAARWVIYDIFIVQATVTRIIDYDFNIFIVPATGQPIFL